MIANRRRERTVALPAAATTVLVGRDAQGNGGREGVLNGGYRARLHLSNAIAENLTVLLFARATRGASPVGIGSQPLAALSSLTVTLDETDCAAYELFAQTTSAGGGDIDVDWAVLR